MNALRLSISGTPYTRVPLVPLVPLVSLVPHYCSLLPSSQPIFILPSTSYLLVIVYQTKSHDEESTAVYLFTNGGTQWLALVPRHNFDSSLHFVLFCLQIKYKNSVYVWLGHV